MVLKVESPDLPHKTEAGVIRLNLRNADEVRAGYDAVMANASRVSPPPRINGVLVQPMVPQGVEMVVGARIDPLFGPLVVVGLGGILVEVLQDTALAPAPVTHADALAMLRVAQRGEAAARVPRRTGGRSRQAGRRDLPHFAFRRRSSRQRSPSWTSIR